MGLSDDSFRKGLSIEKRFRPGHMEETFFFREILVMNYLEDGGFAHS